MCGLFVIRLTFGVFYSPVNPGRFTRNRLDTLLAEMIKDQLSRFVWLRQFEIGNNSPDANRLLDRLEFLQKMNIFHQRL